MSIITTARLRYIARRALNHFGTPRQLDQIAEEGAELGLAALKLKRALAKERNTPSDTIDEATRLEQLAGEAADCLLVIEQIRIICGDRAVDDALHEKAERLAKIVNVL